MDVWYLLLLRKEGRIGGRKEHGMKERRKEVKIVRKREGMWERKKEK